MIVRFLYVSLGYLLQLQFLIFFFTLKCLFIIYIDKTCPWRFFGQPVKYEHPDTKLCLLIYYSLKIYGIKNTIENIKVEG